MRMYAGKDAGRDARAPTMLKGVLDDKDFFTDE